MAPLKSAGTRLLRRLRAWRARHGPSRYRLGEVAITLPAGHPLPAYQAEHPLYDRFLPVLAAHLAAGEVAVDVGANCGDTLAAMHAAQPALHYVCVEADPGFFALLEANAARIAAARPDAQITLIQALVGEAIGTATLAGAAGTRHAVADASPGALAAQRLCDLLGDRGIAAPRLIKSDVDGFDYDVIQSAGALLAEPLPLLFFECQFADQAQRRGYDDLFARLAANGYADWTLFDNFGNPLLRTDRLGDVAQLLDYVARQHRGAAPARSTTTTCSPPDRPTTRWSARCCAPTSGSARTRGWRRPCGACPRAS